MSIPQEQPGVRPGLGRRMVVQCGVVAIAATSVGLPETALAVPISIKVTAAKYDADPTGIRDSTGAFNAALAALNGGGQLLVPAGVYLILGNVSYSGSGPLSILGDGQDTSVLNIQTTSGSAFSIDIVSSATQASVSIRDISFNPNGGSAPLGCTAISLSFPNPGYVQNLSMDNVNFCPGGGSAFTTAIALTNAGRVNIKNVSAHGGFPNGPVSGTTFLTLGGCIDCRFDNISIDNLDVGFYVSSYCEGIHITNSVIITNTGISTGTSAYKNAINLLGIYIRDCEINCNNVGLYLYQVTSGFVSTTHIGSKGFSSAAVYLSGSSNMQFSECLMTGAYSPSTTGPYYGFYFVATSQSSAADNQFDDCQFQNLNIAFEITGNCLNNTGIGNRMFNYGLGTLVGGSGGTNGFIVVVDNSGSSTNEINWVASSSQTGSNHTTDRLLYSQPN